MTKTTLTISDVAKAASVTRVTLYNWQASGRFAVRPIDEHKPARYNPDAICEWLKISRDELAQRIGG